MAAADLLEKDWNVGADVFSVTSFTELRRDGMEASRACARHLPSWESRLGAKPVAENRRPHRRRHAITFPPSPISSGPGSPIAYTTLGTDGFGRSDTRANLRRFFEVDRHAVVVAALAALGDARAAEAAKRYNGDLSAAPPWTR